MSYLTKYLSIPRTASEFWYWPQWYTYGYYTDLGTKRSVQVGICQSFASACGRIVGEAAEMRKASASLSSPWQMSQQMGLSDVLSVWAAGVLFRCQLTLNYFAPLSPDGITYAPRKFFWVLREGATASWYLRGLVRSLMILPKVDNWIWPQSEFLQHHGFWISLVENSTW